MEITTKFDIGDRVTYPQIDDRTGTIVSIEVMCYVPPTGNFIGYNVFLDDGDTRTYSERNLTPTGEPRVNVQVCPHCGFLFTKCGECLTRYIHGTADYCPDMECPGAEIRCGGCNGLVAFGGVLWECKALRYGEVPA